MRPLTQSSGTDISVLKTIFLSVNLGKTVVNRTLSHDV